MLTVLSASHSRITSPLSTHREKEQHTKISASIEKVYPLLIAPLSHGQENLLVCIKHQTQQRAKEGYRTGLARYRPFRRSWEGGRRRLFWFSFANRQQERRLV